MEREKLIDSLNTARWYDLTQALSLFTPPWPGEMPLQVHFFKRLTGSYHGGQGANGQLIEWSNNTGTHLVGPRAFHSGERAIADISLTYCSASSLVGTRIRLCISFNFGSAFCTIGIAHAAVLPEPVSATATMSLPSLIC